MKPAEAFEHVQSIVRVLRGQRVILDSDLAVLYGVENRALLQAVKRNIERFPADFMFQLTHEEATRSRSQTVILNAQPTDIAHKGEAGSPIRRGTNVKYLPYAFADCLKYRNKLGTDVAIHALREYRRGRRSVDELFAAARVCRVERTLRTYLEVMA